MEHMSIYICTLYVEFAMVAFNITAEDLGRVEIEA